MKCKECGGAIEEGRQDRPYQKCLNCLRQTDWVDDAFITVEGRRCFVDVYKFSVNVGESGHRDWASMMFTVYDGERPSCYHLSEYDGPIMNAPEDQENQKPDDPILKDWEILSKIKYSNEQLEYFEIVKKALETDPAGAELVRRMRDLMSIGKKVIRLVPNRWN